jgi:hypothetical protein
MGLTHVFEIAVNPGVRTSGVRVLLETVVREVQGG